MKAALLIVASVWVLAGCAKGGGISDALSADWLCRPSGGFKSVPGERVVNVYGVNKRCHLDEFGHWTFLEPWMTRQRKQQRRDEYVDKRIPEGYGLDNETSQLLNLNP